MTRSDIDHYEGLVFWGPYDEAMIDALIGAADIPAGGRAVDVGCGNGALLLGLAQARDVAVIGVDRSQAALDLAAARFADAGLAPRATWLAQDAGSLSFDDGSLDVVAWLGGPHVGDGHAGTMQTFARWLRPGGTLLLGQGFWASPPPPAYLEATGIALADLDDEEAMLAAVRAAGFAVHERLASTRAHWDAFEDTIHANHERLAEQDPDPAHLAAKRAWHDAQVRWGRDVMGFGLYRATRCGTARMLAAPPSPLEPRDA